MSQDYVDDLYEQNIVSDTTLQNMEKNFAALKSSFFGATTPSNTVAGMWWFDTTADILKLRNEANNVWQSIWDFANNKPVITNLSNEITGAMIAAAIKDPAAGTAGLRTLGTGAQQAMPGNATATPSDASVSQNKLKTSTATITRTGISSAGPYTGLALLAGSLYAFESQGSCTNGDGVRAWFTIGGDASNKIQYTNGAAPKSEIYYEVWRTGVSTNNYFHISRKYVTSSGEVFWMFFKRDRISKIIIEVVSAPDHPCMGNGGEPATIEHPFGSYDELKHEIVVVNFTLDEFEQITKEDNREINDIVLSDYEIDENSNPAWPSIPVTVGLPKHIKDKKGKKILVDYRFMHKELVVEPLKKVIPKPDYIKVKTLKRINHA